VTRTLPWLVALSAACAGAPPPPPAPPPPKPPRAKPVAAPDATPALALGLHHVCALAADGSVWCWGRNDDGQVGDGSLVSRAAPVRVTGLTGAVGLALGSEHSCAWAGDGSVRCWGANYRGQLGDGKSKPRPVPVRLEGLPPVRRVAAGSAHTCALGRDDTAWCWGANAYGQLGLGGKGERVSRPQQLTGLPAVRTLSAGGDVSCAVDAAGGAWCWGSSSDLQAGGREHEDAVVLPRRIAGVERVRAIYHAPRTVWAVRTDGQVYRWGVPRLFDKRGWGEPPKLLGGLSGLRAVAQGSTHACLLYGDGTVGCYGDNRSAQLGFISNGEWVEQPRVVTGLSGVVAIGASGEQTCVLDGAGRVSCWGEDVLDSVGRGAPNVPVRVAGLGSVVALSAAGFETCALRDGGDVWCWGCMRRRLVEEAKAISVGPGHACAILTGDLPACWGEGACCQLGDSPGSDAVLPVRSKALSDVVAIAAGSHHSCAADARGALWCWGAGCDHDLDVQGGFSRTQASSVIEPTEVWQRKPAPVAALSVGDGLGCTLSRAASAGAERRVECWRARDGKLRDVSVRAVPIRQPVQVAVGGAWACGRRRDGKVRCWDAALLPKGVPDLVDAKDLDVGRHRACAVLEGGGVSCWERPETGLGDPPRPSDALDAPYDAEQQPVVIPAPQPVAGLADATRVAVGASHACAIDGKGDPWCWGDVLARTLGSRAFENGGGPRLVFDPGRPTASRAE